MRHSLCPSADELSDFATGKLTLDRVDALAEHLDGCGACAAAIAGLDHTPDPLVAQLRRSLPASTADAVDSARVVALVESLGGWKGPSPKASLPSAKSGSELPRLGQYVLLEKLGEGGMGQVYKARHELMNRVVALKIIHPKRLESAAAVQRFQREIRALAQLDHPNIVRAEYADQADDTHFLVMEYVEGVSLAELVRRQGPLPVASACACIAQAARGLQHAFEQGLVHRDLKPSNLMLTAAGQIKLLDLGLARGREDLAADDLTASGQMVGTVDYMAPEQADDPHGADIRADIYSLGCTLYFLLAGRAPFDSAEYSSMAKKLKAHAAAPVPALTARRSDVPDGLVAVLERMLAKEPAGRYATPGEVIAALGPWATDADLRPLALASAPTRDERPASTVSEQGRTQEQPRHRLGTDWKSVLRSRHTLVLGGVAVLLLLGVLLHTGVFSPGGDPDGADPNKTNGGLPGDSPSVVSFKIGHYRGETATYQGSLGVTSSEARENDDLRVDVQLSRPAYCYLIAFNPNGEAQLCHPADAAAVPELVESFQYPPSPIRFFWLSDGAGLQAFVLIASATPLPAYTGWQARAGQARWKPADIEGCWRFDGERWRLERGKRGKERDRGAPAALQDLTQYFRDQAPAAAVHAWAFPVKSDKN